MKIAVDFDGTIVEHEYPKIGKEMAFAFTTLKELQKQGHHIVLWTFRSGKELDEAVEYCSKNGLEFFAVNESEANEDFDPEKMSRNEGEGPILNPTAHLNKSSSLIDKIKNLF